MQAFTLLMNAGQCQFSAGWNELQIPQGAVAKLQKKKKKKKEKKELSW